MGKERLEEIADPEIAMQRAISTYRKKGYSEEWMEQRIETIKTRKKLTAEWNRVGVKEGLEYAILTNDITKAWPGMTTKEYKQHKGLKKQGLRDNMTDMELILNILAEKTTTEISQADNPNGFHESCSIAQEGGELVGDYRRRLEKRTWTKIHF